MIYMFFLCSVKKMECIVCKQPATISIYLKGKNGLEKKSICVICRCNYHMLTLLKEYYHDIWTRRY